LSTNKYAGSYFLSDVGPAVLNILPYYSGKQSDGAVITLRELLDTQHLTFLDCAFIVRHLSNYLTILHGDGLVLQPINEENILVHVNNFKQVDPFLIAKLISLITD
jgi:hypothetical protein